MKELLKTMKYMIITCSYVEDPTAKIETRKEFCMAF